MTDTPTETKPLISGHPPGCTCGECAVRRAHLEGAHNGPNDTCKHRVCLICAGCDECEQRQRDEEHAQYIGRHLKMLAEGIVNARRGVFTAIRNLQELTGPAYDIELAEGPDGPDALADLEAADKLLRNVNRIIRAREQLFKEGS